LQSPEAAVASYLFPQEKGTLQNVGKGK